MSIARSFLLPFALASIALGTLGCGSAPPPKPATSETQSDAGEQDKIEKSKRKIADANRAFNAKTYDKARKLLAEARELGVESQKYDIDELLEKIDKKQARLYVNEADDKLKQKDCAGAFKDLAAAIDAMKSETFARELRRLVQPDAVKCVQASVDESTLAGNYAAARTLVNAKETKTVLGPERWKKTSGELDGTVAEALKAQLADDLKAKKWSDAISKLDASVKKGDADESQANVILKAIREAVTPELAAQLTRGVGSKDASATLRAADATIKLVRWEPMLPDAAALSKDKALPEDLFRKREALATWVEGQRVGLKPLKKAEKRWTHGKVALISPSKIDGESRRDLPGGTQVWLVGQTKEKALIAETEPSGSTAAQLEKVVGWVPLDRLAKESTEDWVPPDDQLKGARVWGPLRPPETLLELGTVSDVSDKEISVKRLADDSVIKVPRKSLRNGRLAPGTKVTAVCRNKDETAKVLELLTAGRAVPAVKIKCDGGEEKEEFLPALRAKPEFLPASK